MTVCDKNGFKSMEMMETANMSNFRLMAKSKPFLFWPNNSMEVEQCWNKITFGLKELVDKIGVRYNGGIYCYISQDDYGQLMYPR